jgi:hypothetical protein
MPSGVEQRDERQYRDRSSSEAIEPFALDGLDEVGPYGHDLGRLAGGFLPDHDAAV